MKIRKKKITKIYAPNFSLGTCIAAIGCDTRIRGTNTSERRSRIGGKKTNAAIHEVRIEKEGRGAGKRYQKKQQISESAMETGRGGSVEALGKGKKKKKRIIRKEDDAGQS